MDVGMKECDRLMVKRDKAKRHDDDCEIRRDASRKK